MLLLATPASVPTETALLLPLKDAVPDLDKYPSLSGQFVNGLAVSGFEEVVGSCECVE